MTAHFLTFHLCLQHQTRRLIQTSTESANKTWNTGSFIAVIISTKTFLSSTSHISLYTEQSLLPGLEEENMGQSVLFSLRYIEILTRAAVVNWIDPQMEIIWNKWSIYRFSLTFWSHVCNFMSSLQTYSSCLHHIKTRRHSSSWSGSKCLIDDIVFFKDCYLQ